MVNVKAVDPASPSASETAVVDSEMTGGGASSFRMAPVAVLVPRIPPFVGADRVTVKPSSASTVVSLATLIVIVVLLWPAMKFTVAAGSRPPVKSAALAALAPDPVTA